MLSIKWFVDSFAVRKVLFCVAFSRRPPSGNPMETFSVLYAKIELYTASVGNLAVKILIKITAEVVLLNS